MPALVKICMLFTLSLDLRTNLVTVVYMYMLKLCSTYIFHGFSSYQAEAVVKGR